MRKHVRLITIPLTTDLLMSQYLEGGIIAAAEAMGIVVDDLYGQWNVASMTVVDKTLLVAVEFFLEVHRSGGAS